jgi:hypothetical protein
MTDSILGSCPPKDEPPAGWGVLLALLAGWGITGRLALLISIPIAAIVVVVVIYLGPIGVGALLTGGGIKRFLFRCRRRCIARS